MRAAILFLLAALTCGAQTATFVKTDTTTGANYKGVYGASGSVIALQSSTPPPTASYTVVGDSTYTWASGVYGGTCFYAAPTFSISLNITGTQQIALYAIDYDQKGRGETFQVLNGSIILDTRTISAFMAGNYVVWDISGAVTIKITATAGPNAVVSAIFFDPGPQVTPPPIGVTINWTLSTTTTVTNQIVWRANSATAVPTAIAVLAPTVTSYVDASGVAGDVYTVTAVITTSVPSNQAVAQ